MGVFEYDCGRPSPMGSFGDPVGDPLEAEHFSKLECVYIYIYMHIYTYIYKYAPPLLTGLSRTSRKRQLLRFSHTHLWLLPRALMASPTRTYGWQTGKLTSDFSQIFRNQNTSLINVDHAYVCARATKPHAYPKEH